MGVLLILAPAVALYGGWLALLYGVLPPEAAQDESISAFILSLVIASALLWLLGDRLARGTWRRTLLGALGMTIGVAVLTALSLRSEMSSYTASLMGGLSVPMLAIVAGYALAGRYCHRLYRRTTFAFWLAIGMAVAGPFGSLVFIILQCTLMRTWPNEAVTLLGLAAMAGFVVGVVTFLISLPFLLLGLRSPLFRPRLFACLQLPAEPGSYGMPGTPISSAGGDRGMGAIPVSNPGANSRRME
jgi:hypothetical protein